MLIKSLITTFMALSWLSLSQCSWKLHLYNVIIIAPSLLSLPSPSVISLLLSLSYVLPLIISSGDLIPLILDTPQSNPWFSSGFLHIQVSLFGVYLIWPGHVSFLMCNCVCIQKDSMKCWHTRMNMMTHNNQQNTHTYIYI